MVGVVRLLLIGAVGIAPLLLLFDFFTVPFMTELRAMVMALEDDGE